MVGRGLLATVIVGIAFQHAAAQFGGAPGTLPGASPAPSPAPRPPQCQALLAQRDEVQKHGQAIEAANRKQADVKVACGLFRRSWPKPRCSRCWKRTVHPAAQHPKCFSRFVEATPRRSRWAR
jgi:hypothetical protein